MAIRGSAEAQGVEVGALREAFAAQLTKARVSTLVWVSDEEVFFSMTFLRLVRGSNSLTGVGWGRVRMIPAGSGGARVEYSLSISRTILFGTVVAFLATAASARSLGVGGCGVFALLFVVLVGGNALLTRMQFRSLIRHAFTACRV